MQHESRTTAGPSESKARPATPQVEVQALDYLQLRELAEAAAGVENQSVDFFFPGGTVLKRAAAGQRLEDTDILVPAYKRGKFPRNTITLSLSGDPDQGRTVPGADAVFWTDASVHKFLIPYVASFAGESAAAFVALVQQAWNFYPVDEFTVYALVHLTTTEIDVELDPGLSLCVAFVAAGSTELDLLPVDQFVKKFDPVVRPDPDPVTVKYHRGDGKLGPQRPDYQELRAMAEWASSLRDVPEYFLFRQGERGFRPPVPELPDVLSGDIVVPAFSPTVPQDRPVLPGVFLQAEGQPTPRNLASDADALFWSSGSIEQFVIPYYASKGGLQSLPNLAHIADVWENTGPGQMPGEHGKPIDVPGAATVEAEADLEVQVFGLVHLPTSQWAEVGAGFTVTQVNPASQIGMVTVTRTGETRLHRPHHFTGRR